MRLTGAALLLLALSSCASSAAPVPCPPPPAPPPVAGQAWASLAVLAFGAKGAAQVCDAVIESLAVRGDKDAALGVLERCEQGLGVTNAGLMAVKEALDEGDANAAACAVPGAVAGLRALCRSFEAIKAQCPAVTREALSFAAGVHCVGSKT